MSSLGMRSR